jgi:hypothetical protein
MAFKISEAIKGGLSDPSLSFRLLVFGRTIV